MAGVPVGLLNQSAGMQGLLARDRNEGLLNRIADWYGNTTFFKPTVDEMVSAFALPGDVYAGKVDPRSDEAIERSLNLVGSMSPAGLAGPSGVVGSGMTRAAKNLPMDDAARLARAQQQGFNIDEPLYHGTDATFAEFQVSPPRRSAGSDAETAAYFTSDPEIADHFAKLASIKDVPAGDQPHEVFEYMGKTYAHVFDGAQVYQVLIKPGKQKVVERPHYNSAEFAQIIDEARQQGYDTVRFKGVKGEGKYGSVADQVAVLNPANIRSPRAAFDPRRSGSADILAAGGPGAIIPAGIEAALEDR